MPIGETNPKTKREEILDTVLARLSVLPAEPRMIVMAVASALIDSVKMNGNEGLLALALCSAQLAVEAEQKTEAVNAPQKIILLNDGKVIH